MSDLCGNDVSHASDDNDDEQLDVYQHLEADECNDPPSQPNQTQGVEGKIKSSKFITVFFKKMVWVPFYKILVALSMMVWG